MRLDVRLHEQYPEVSRAVVQRLIKNGLVQVNGAVQKKTGYVMKEADKLKVDYDFNSKPKLPSKDADIPVLHEDDDCVVINKPLGMLTHSKGAFNPEVTVASWLATRKGFKFADDSTNERLGIVHRLDRATTGVMICAKNPDALKHLQKQFQDRKTKKTYIARIEGSIRPEQAIVDLPIERNPKQPQRFRVGQNGKPSITSYKTIGVVERPKRATDSLLELKPQTGRTHQLRVHLHYLKHPIVGDTFYDGRKADRLYLHAYKLEITLPNKSRETFTAEVPEVFKDSKA